MAERLNPSEELTSWEDIAYSNMVQNEAGLRLLVKKGIIIKEEFIEESRKVHEVYIKKQKSISLKFLKSP